MPGKILHDARRRNHDTFANEPRELLIAMRTAANAAAFRNHPVPRNEVAFIFGKLRQHRDGERRRNAGLRREALRRRNAPDWNFAKKRQQLGF